MPGMTTRLNLQADQPGTYRGLSAQFSGDGFSDMRFDLTAVGVDEFRSWVNTTKTQGGILDAGTFADLARPARAEKPAIYGEVAEGLFESIVTGHMSASPPQREH
jgi:cytochrome o ubiquinol oxidase subunit II